MAKHNAKPIINKTSKKESPGVVNSAMPAPDPGFRKKPATRQTGPIANKGKRGRHPGGKNHRNVSKIGGSTRGGGKLNYNTRKNSLQGSDSTQGWRRGAKPGGPDTGKTAKRPVA